MADFKVQFSDGGRSLSVMFSGDTPSLFRAEMGETQVVNIGAPPYTGEYIVTPSPDGTILKTKNTLLTDDLTVEPIPPEYGLVSYSQNKHLRIT